MVVCDIFVFLSELYVYHRFIRNKIIGGEVTNHKTYLKLHFLLTCNYIYIYDFEKLYSDIYSQVTKNEALDAHLEKERVVKLGQRKSKNHVSFSTCM